ncbi:hypothetical protein [Roseibium aggregatum]|uniref:hypothetical protein n=1 Tax=Roseibium aggregatum TaxID=187304 RepID=UPI001E4DEFE2|nr:hypothetical protein [Roseibium aggregatum]UES41809.1 hypothetical protein GFC08_27760 [Roseibium aggregatum]
MIELFIVTWFAVGVAEHSLVDGTLDRVALGADVSVVSAGRIVKSGGVCLQPEVSLLSSFGVTSLPAPFLSCRASKNEYRDSLREPMLVMPRTNFSSDALFSLRCFLISFGLALGGAMFWF